MSKTKLFDPLTYIPAAEIVRGRLVQAELLVKRLRILLRTAEEIERAGDHHEQEAAVNDQ